MDLNELKGIGPKGITLLHKLGIQRGIDLVQYYPFRYEVLKRTDLSALKPEDPVIIDGIVETNPSIFYFSKKMDKMNFKLNTGSSLLSIVIFNRGFLKRKLIPGSEVTVIGKYDAKYRALVATDLRFGLLKEETIEGVYHTTYGLTGKQIASYITETLPLIKEVPDYIPDYLKEKYHFREKMECLEWIHHPHELEKLKFVQNQLKYEELFLFMLEMNYLKERKKGQIGLKRTVPFSQIETFIAGLPFSFTLDQKKSVMDIYQDMTCEKRMNRLLQGDVGSGKTVVAAVAMYLNYLSGYQSALMAPTELLAIQHMETMKNLFQGYPIRMALLTGKMKAKEKKEIAKGLEEGTIDFIIGTHTLIQENVHYANLGLVITDEQHRFGVNQRGNLKNKGCTPDILYMSATPIPRTYALTIYGDMEVSNIYTMPKGRKEIITLLKKESEMKDVLELMFEQLKSHHQIYVIAPLIEESDKIDLENTKALEDKMKKAFGKFFQIGVLHGKMSGNEKEEVMGQFQRNEIQLLISTTVIEVGVDVKNATMIVIFDSFRFGLSALHQLRGRVGRNDLQSYCILISNRETERLKVLTRTNDGFKVSEEDFLLRGSGDLFGMRQSGDMAFRIADLKKDYPILLRAKEDSLEFIEKGFLDDPNYSLWKNRVEDSRNLG